MVYPIDYLEGVIVCLSRDLYVCVYFCNVYVHTRNVSCTCVQWKRKAGNVGLHHRVRGDDVPGRGSGIMGPRPTPTENAQHSPSPNQSNHYPH